MNQKQITDLTAAILTLSEGLDATHEVMRRTLSFQAELQETKILERFIPPPVRPTENRFQRWKEQMESGI
ncbi:MAG: hypothetical protein JW860_05220 [Sedimentisphaerales bacterium]|nr:hypothetical protein [Sedimentisphaerales bacterium]